MSRGIRIGLDIGGTAIKAVRVEADGAINLRRTFETGQQPDRLARLAAITAVVRDLANGAPIEFIGIAVGGLVRPDGSMPAAATNLPELAEAPLAPVLTPLLGVRPTILNDAHAAIYGEAWRGAAQGLSDVLMVTLGTGIGGGLMLDGRVRHGTHGSAGEIGAWTVAGDTSFETEASPANFERRNGKRLGDALLDRTHGAVVASLVDTIGRHLAAAHVLLDLEAIVIGGSIAAVGEPLCAIIDAAIRRHCPAPMHHDLKVVTSALGPYAGAIGAVAPTARGVV